MTGDGCLSPGRLGVAISLGGIFLPLLLMIVATGIAALLGCELNEGGVGVCMWGQTDWMPFLTWMALFGWFIVLTPLWVILLVLSIVLLSYERRRDAEWQEEE